MEKIEQIVIQLAERYRNPDDFLRALEEPSVPQNKKASLFFDIGSILFKYSYFQLALSLWNYSLQYFIENKDKSRESTCYTNIGIVHDSLGDFKKAILYHEKALKIKREIGDKSEISPRCVLAQCFFATILSEQRNWYTTQLCILWNRF